MRRKARCSLSHAGIARVACSGEHFRRGCRGRSSRLALERCPRCRYARCALRATTQARVASAGALVETCCLFGVAWHPVAAFDKAGEPTAGGVISTIASTAEVSGSQVGIGLHHLVSRQVESAELAAGGGVCPRAPCFEERGGSTGVFRAQSALQGELAGAGATGCMPATARAL